MLIILLAWILFDTDTQSHSLQNTHVPIISIVIHYSEMSTHLPHIKTVLTIYGQALIYI